LALRAAQTLSKRRVEGANAFIAKSYCRLQQFARRNFSPDDAARPRVGWHGRPRSRQRRGLQKRRAHGRGLSS